MKKALIALLVVILFVTPLCSCTVGGTYYSEDDILSIVQDWLDDYYGEDSDDGEEGDADQDGVTLALTYPVGYSPNVFTTGWVFGASCYFEGVDYSNQVEWSGSGTFNPGTGSRSRPSFSAPGSNRITLSVKIKDTTYIEEYTVTAVSPSGYASVGTQCKCDAYSMGCIGCPHTAVGPISSGSSQVFINGKPAARSGDIGIACPCCGPCEFKIVGGDPEVLINGRPAATWKFSTVQFAGGTGIILIGE